MREGTGRGLSLAGHTGVWLPLWGSSPHPWGAGKAMWLSLCSCHGFRQLKFCAEAGVEGRGLEEMGLAWVPSCPPPPESDRAQDPASTGQAESNAGPDPASGQPRW